MAPLAPLHNPANLVAIEAALKNYPGVPQVAVFDTAFHQGMPPYAFHYAVPYEFYKDYHVRRYGFHGTSISLFQAGYLSWEAAKGEPDHLHLKWRQRVAGGKVDTSMGLTP
jgi:acetate kinase